MYKKLSILLLFAGFLTAFSSHAQQIPTGRAISIADILTLGQSLWGFLMALGGILAGITIILSGIFYFFAGSNAPKVAAAKGILKGGIIGALIIFSVGVIMATVQNFATDPLQFFGGGGGGGTPTGYCDLSNNICIGGINSGSLCNTNADC